ncbi:MAG: RNA 2',3'-cyclic phosphodiesterase [Acidimicrobiia bacterium]
MNDPAFLAVDLSEDDRHALSAALAEASPGAPIPGKKPPPEKWHFTLRYLGECTDVQAEQIVHHLSEAVDEESRRVWCNGLGAFPRASKAGVVYASVDDPSGILRYLAAVCDEAATDAGFESEGRPYVPHLTLSRLRPGQDVRSLFAGYGEFRVPIVVGGITLFRTRQTRGGPRYDPIDTVPLP